MAADTKQAKTGRDAKGRMLPGFTVNPNGRPKRINLLRLAKERLEQDLEEWNGEGKRPDNLEDAMWRVFQAMMVKAAMGDVRAAQLVIEHIAEHVNAAPESEGDEGKKGPAPPIDAKAFAKQLKRTAAICVEVLPSDQPGGA